jgi:hypothetical protein
VDIVNWEVFDSLLYSKVSPAVSIYLPTHRLGPETQQDPIRLRNLLADVRRSLVESGMRGPDADELIRPASNLIDDLGFWQHQEEGLVLFMGPGRFDSYRLPVAFRELVVVSDSFHVKPLVQVMSRGERFYILALSQQQVRLLWATRYRVGEVDLGDIPVSLAKSPWFEGSQLQFHQSGTRGRGRPTAIFHGQGMGKETSVKRLERFFRAVDGGIAHLVEPDAPLVLAGVEFLLPIYRKVSRRRTILDGEVVGNPEESTGPELHERAWRLASDYFAKERDAAMESFSSGASPTEQTIEMALPAASEGRVEALFVEESAISWGIRGASGGVEVHEARQPGDRDLLDVAVAETWKHRGSVYQGLPEQVSGVIAAVLRY